MTKGQRVIVSLGVEGYVVGKYLGERDGVITVDGKPAAVVEVEGREGCYDSSSIIGRMETR